MFSWISADILNIWKSPDFVSKYCPSNDTAKTTKSFVKSLPQQTQPTVYRFFLNKWDNIPADAELYRFLFLFFLFFLFFFLVFCCEIVSCWFRSLYRQECTVLDQHRPGWDLVWDSFQLWNKSIFNLFHIGLKNVVSCSNHTVQMTGKQRQRVN